MNDVFSDLVNICVVIYLDDILIYSADKAEHTQQVREVLRRLYKNGLYARADKYEFHSDTVEYLGYILSPEELTMLSDKVCTIMDWLESHRVKDIQLFLDFCNFYCRFIENYSNIVVPLMRLTCKGALWDFSESCKLAFVALKGAFMSAPVLAHWVLDIQIIVETNTFDYALRAILSIYSADFDIHPITFHSHTFSAPELNYDVHDKELLAIFEAFKVWQYYLEGPHLLVDVITNYKNLTYFSTTRILTH